MVLTMRVLHVVFGVFWAGTLMFNALFLLPALRDAGPDGAKIVAGLARRRFLTVMPLVALITIAAGFWLYWFDSGGFQPAFMRSTMGMTLGIGAAIALVAFVLGIAIVRPAMAKAAVLGQDPAQQAAALQLRMKAAAANQWIAILLTLTAVAMAIARYV